MEDQHSLADMEAVLTNQLHKESFARRMKVSSLVALGGFVSSMLITTNKDSFEQNHTYLGALVDEWQGPAANTGLIVGFGGILTTGALVSHRAIQKKREQRIEIADFGTSDMITSSPNAFRRVGKRIMSAVVQASALAVDLKYDQPHDEALETIVSIPKETDVNLRLHSLEEFYWIDHGDFDESYSYN